MKPVNNRLHHWKGGNMKILSFKTVLLLFVLLFVLSLSAKTESFIVKNLTAYDNPNDDGSGIVVKWTPLPNAMHILEYRVYRGISPDTLFLLGSIPVDPIAGFAGKEMFFYDKDYHDFVSILSSPKLKKEAQQGPKSPLCRAIPSDPKIFGPLIKHYAVLATIPKKSVYYHSQLVHSGDKAFAGLDLYRCESMLANVLPGKKYYYTVVAIDEKRKMSQYAPLVSAIPYDNPPESDISLNARYFQTMKQLNLEWTLPLNKSDVAEYHFYALPKSRMAAFQAFLNEQIAMNSYYEKQQLEPNKYKDNPTPKLTNPALLVGISPNPLYPVTDMVVHFDAKGKIIDPTGKITASLDLNHLNDYAFIVGLPDFFGFESFSPMFNVKYGKPSELPILPQFTVKDKPNDKGDTNELSFGRPLASISQAYYNASKTKLIFNYDYATNANYKIIHVFFKIYDKKGNYIGTQNEYYPDNIFKFKLPKDSKPSNEYFVKIGFKLKGPALKNNFYITQKIMLDPSTKRFANKGIYLDSENLNRFSYLVLSKSKSDPGFQQIKKLSTISRNFDDNIPFETNIFKGIDSYDKKTGKLLFDPTLDIGYDEKAEMPISVNIFASEMKKSMEKWQKQVDSLKTVYATVKGPEKESIKQQMDYYQKMIDLVNGNADIRKLNSITDAKERMKLIAKLRETSLRSFAYKLIKSDGDGNFLISEEFRDPSGMEYFFPIPNWFDHEKWPMIISSLIFTILVFVMGVRTKRGKDLFIRPIAGIDEIDNAVGRATEMGRPILYVPGLNTIGDIATIASMIILGRIAKKTAEYDTKLLVPNNDYYVMPLAQEIVKEGHYEAGRPDSYDQNNVFFISTDQFPYVAGVNGTMIREKTATNFYMGTFYAEALLMTETGNATGAIQIAGTDAVTQIPFFITTCDYTLIGEEFYAASAYLSKDPDIMGTLKAQDYFKFIIVFFVILGTILTTLHINGLIYTFPIE